MICPPRRPRPGAPCAARAHRTLYSLFTSHPARRALPLAWLLALGLLPGAARAATFSIANGDVTALTNAITTANGNGQADTINLAAGGTYTFTTGDGGGDTALPFVNDDVAGQDLTLNGNGATIARSTAGGTPEFRLLVFGSGATTTVNGVTFSNGNLATNGGGLYNLSGTLMLNNCTLSGNSATSNGYGGGIYNDGLSFGSASLTLNSCTLSGNSASGDAGGGGIFNNSGGTLTVENSTLSQNSAIIGGGGIYNNGTLTVNNSTLSQNSAGSGGGINNSQGTVTVNNSTLSQNSASNGFGGGIYNALGGTLTVNNSTLSQNSAQSGGGIGNDSGPLTVQNSIVALNTASDTGPDLYTDAGTLSGDYNLIQATDGWIAFGSHNITGQDPLLGALANNGGPTKTMRLLAGSPALDAGKNFGSPLPTTDQRGKTRPVDLATANAPGGDGSDIGAYELQVETTQSGPGYVVNTTDDAGAVGACTNEDCTLREAITAANGDGADSTITFASGLSGSITLTSALPDLSTKLTITGPGANLLVVDGNNLYRIFNISSGSSGNNTGPIVSLSGLTLTNAKVQDSNGGAIFSDRGQLSLTNCTISGNTAAGTGSGGGLYNFRGTLTVTGCTFRDNSAGRHAGGIANDASILTGVASLTVINCTFSANSSSSVDGQGGAIFNNGYNGSATLRVTSSTFSGNSAKNGGAIYNSGTNPTGTTNATLGNSLFSGNTPSNLFDDGGGGTITTAGYNLSSDASGGFLSDGTDQNSVSVANIGLDPAGLQDNGGPTKTIKLLAGSFAIDQGKSDAIAALSVSTDQRGRVRPFDTSGVTNLDDGSDIGAYESGEQNGNTLIVNSTADTDDGFCTDSDCTLREAITLANARTGANTITFAGSVTPAITLLTALPNLSDNVTISGPGAAVLTVQRSAAGGTPNFSVFTVSNATLSGPTVGISGLTISNGSAQGGGINNNHGQLTVSSCVISNNHIAGTGNNGGGINNDGSGGGNATLLVQDSTISGNTINDLSSGGGIFNDSRGGTASVTVTNSTISDNHVNGGGGGEGGIGSEGAGSVTVTGSTISGNTALTGAGLYLNGSTLILSGSTISGNTATNDGGGLNLVLTTATLTGNTISGNTATTGSGVSLYSATATLTGNTINGNSSDGVTIAGSTATGVSVRNNSIFNNGGLGIDLNNDDVTPNDAGDGDSGPNGLQNFPVLTAATSSGTDTTIVGTLNSTANTTFTVDFYDNAAADPSGYGEGQTYLGATTAVTPLGGNDVSFNATIAGFTPTAGHFITATATDPAGHTSEFSRALDPFLQTGPDFVVNVTNDNAGVCTLDDCSLREAINAANLDGVDSTISFNIPGPVGGVQTISPATQLPNITAKVTIDGYTQPGASANTLSSGTDAVLLIEISGTGSFNGLRISAANCTVKGLSITNCSIGVVLTSVSATATVLSGNYIGVRTDGTTRLANGSGVQITGAPSNTIGGSTAAARNVISGNSSYGIVLDGNTATGNTVAGNYIGTTADGTTKLANAIGVDIEAPNNIIGGAAAGVGNLISGNNNAAVYITGGTATGNTVAGNYIGTTADGTTKLGNTNHGVVIDSAASNTIGGTSVAARNVISGNNGHGIVIDGNTATGNTVAGNYIGITADGTTKLANGNGVFIRAPSNIIGGSTAGARNVISGNSFGVHITGGTATGNTVAGNYIGTTADGTTALANSNGVVIDSAASNTIGGTSVAARNVISGNNGNGIIIDGNTATGNTVAGNYVGTTADGTTKLGNSGNGVSITGPNNIIGGSTAGARNVISGNATGIRIFISTATGNTVAGNYIGTNAAGDTARANDTGISIENGASSNTIGGTTAGAGNLISGNTNAGVFVDGNTATGNTVRGNSISANGGLGIDLKNDGFTLNDAGDADTGPNNLQNLPVLTSVTSNGTDTTVAGTLNSTAGTTFDVDFYDNLAADPSGYGEGQTYLGSDTVTTAGNAGSFSKTLTGFALPAGHFITATATDPAGNTSEFSLAATFNNVAPVNTVPGTKTAFEATDRAISGLAVADADAGAANLTLTLDVDHGTLTLRTDVASGLTAGDLANNGTATVTVTASQAKINATLADATGLMYHGTTGFRGSDTLTVTTNDNGHTGGGGALSDTDTVTINVNEAPSLVVTTASDTSTSIDGLTSLREAITYANNHANAGGTPDPISFAIPGAGVHPISPTSALPDVTEAVLINGATQAGYTDHPLVQLDGTNAGVTANGLKLLGSGSTVRGLDIGKFSGSGVVLAGSGGHRVESCYIGIFDNGIVSTAKPNNRGVQIDSSNNVVGLDKNGTGAANRLWHNTNKGVQVAAAAQGNTLRGNSLRRNTLNIDLGGDGVTPNDNLDGDSGANNLQNFPVLTSAVLGFNKTHTLLSGTLNSQAGHAYRLDFYRSSADGGVAPVGDASKSYLGFLDVTTDGSGNLATPFSFDTGAPVIGTYYSATATDTVTGDTSEFSAPLLQDWVRPSISITAPNPAGGVLTVAANFPQIGGTATDNLPGVTVRLQLQRLSDGMWWDGTNQNWVPTQTADTILPTTTPGAAPGNWHSTGNLPKPSNSTLRDDKYQIVAYAINAAGNQLVAAKTLSYDLHKATVSISTPGTLGQASNSLVNVPSLSTVSGTSAHPLVGMKKVLFKLTRNDDNFQWNGANWVSGGAAQYVTTVLDDPVGSSPAAWHATGALPTVGANTTTQVQVGKVYNLTAVAYDQLDQASNGFLLRVKVVVSASVFKLPSSSKASGSESPSE